jgi:repressor LexA
LHVDRNKYFDINGRNGITDPKELELYIINIYKTLLTRGILGTYLYIVDMPLRTYIQNLLNIKQDTSNNVDLIINTESPYQNEFIQLPLYDSVGCGDAMYADPTSTETYPVPKSLIRAGAKYFVLRTSGDSMNQLGIEEGDYILCRKNYQAPSGSVAVVLEGDDATLKEIYYESDGLLLKPKSTNPRHQPRKLVEGDEFKVLGEFIKKL